MQAGLVLADADFSVTQHHILSHNMAESDQEKLMSSSSDKITYIFSDFMLRIANFDELVETTYRFLIGFRRELELFRRPQLCNKSKVVDQIIEANQTNRLKRYVEAGSRHHYHDVQNIIKLNSCKQGLQDHLMKAKPLLEELKSFKEDAIGIAKSENLSNTCFFGSSTTDEGEPTLDVEDNDYMHLQGRLISYATLMTVLYNMFKLDYNMQETIINSINLTGMKSEQLENYCFMWDLRPYIKENIVRQSWKLVDR